MVFVLPPAGVIAAIPAEVCWPRLPAYVPAELEPAGAAMLVPVLEPEPVPGVPLAHPYRLGVTNGAVLPEPKPRGPHLSAFSCGLGAKVGENKVALLSVFQSPSCASHWQDLI